MAASLRCGMLDSFPWVCAHSTYLRHMAVACQPSLTLADSLPQGLIDLWVDHVERALASQHAGRLFATPLGHAGHCRGGKIRRMRRQDNVVHTRQWAVSRRGFG